MSRAFFQVFSAVTRLTEPWHPIAAGRSADISGCPASFLPQIFLAVRPRKVTITGLLSGIVLRDVSAVVEPAITPTDSATSTHTVSASAAVSHPAEHRGAPLDQTPLDQTPLWGLTPNDQRFLWVSLLITAGLLAGHGWRQASRSAYTVQVVRSPATVSPPTVKPPEVSPALIPAVVAPPRHDAPSPAPAPTPGDYVYRIDINQAEWPAWTQLPGIGETLARRIVAERESHGPFVSIEDLRRVKGVGAKTLDKMRPHLIVPTTP